MNTFLDQFQATCSIGAPRVFGGLTLYPIIQHESKARDYLTLPEALGMEGFSIAEVDDHGIVPQVLVRNALERNVLLIDGEELAGAKQNRVINTSILVPARGQTIIPVSCTEIGRWRHATEKFMDSGLVMPPSMRARKMASVSDSLRKSGEHYSDQGDVWDSIARFSAAAGHRSFTGAMRDVYVSRLAQLDEIQQSFVPCEGQVGLVAANNGSIIGLDWLSSADAYIQLASKLIAGYSMQAVIDVAGSTEPVPEEEIRCFLDELGRCEELVFPGVGIGQEYRYHGLGGVGTALLSDGQIVHGSFQAKYPEVPFARSYWVLPGRLLAGYYPGAPTKGEAEQKLNALLQAGIRCVINLVEEEERNEKGETMRPYHQLLAQAAASRGLETSYVRTPVRDQDVPSAPTMRLILDVIDAALQQRQPVYVHCWGGRGRTGTVVGCFLARHGITRSERTLERISHLRRAEETSVKCSPDNEVQREMVRAWGQGA
ncbi:MAG: dual specificity protein phosphatase family protein [Candidatus Handelsmanbacteria bacterium]|nr:dual specificity protein phosphatase family protein [Candidatus Handelsmanbacteria bacterium]